MGKLEIDKIDHVVYFVRVKMINKKISIIGAGHMGQAIARGFMRGKIIDRNNLILSNGKRNITAAKKGEIIIIAVKPKIVGSVAKEIRNYLKKEAILISSAACVSFDLLEKYFGNERKIVRIMPNLPVAIGAGIVGWIGNRKTMEKDEKLIVKLLSSLGYLIKCKDEGMLDKLTIISGCGPAFVAYFMDNLQKITQKYGFSEKYAERIVNEIFAGTLQYLSISKMESEKFIKSVATKGGITEEIIHNLEMNDYFSILTNSLNGGYAKMRKIQKELNR